LPRWARRPRPRRTARCPTPRETFRCARRGALRATRPSQRCWAKWPRRRRGKRATRSRPTPARRHDESPARPPARRNPVPGAPRGATIPTRRGFEGDEHSMQAPMKTRLAFLAVALLLSAGRPCHAETEREVARSLAFADGIEAMEAKDWERAERIFLGLWAEWQSYDVALTLGQIELKLEKYR